MKTKVLLGAVFGLLLMASAFAQNSDFQFSISPEELSVNPYEIAVYDILIENQGQVDEVYSISIQGIPELWYSLSHEAIEVPSGEEREVYLFITPQPSEEDVYVGELLVNGISQTFQLNIIKEHSLQVSMPSQLTSCICEQDQTMIVVQNTGKYEENIELVLSGDALEIIEVEADIFVVEPNESLQIPVTIKEACETEQRNYNLEVRVESVSSYASAFTFSTVQKKDCFAFELSYPEEVSTCANAEQSFKISVTNTGIREDSYEIGIEELGYSDIIDLEPGQTQEFEITFMEEEEGIYGIPFTVSSDSVSKDGLVNFIVERCYGVDLELDTDELTIESGKGRLTNPSVKNTGTRADTFGITSSAIWIAIRPLNVTLLPNETQEIFVYYSPEFGSVGEFDVELLVESEYALDRETVTVNVEGEIIETTTSVPEETTTTIEEATTTVEMNITTPEENITTTTEGIIEPPEINITKPTGAFTRVWNKILEFSDSLNERVEGLGINKVLLSIIVGFVIALIILLALYFIVMSG
ncbi:MAG: hypothetical protein GF368_00930 [Candidatus Aenigmarchaeota archaeon]|nr:hypothetical protein [Candidatus Aenigmarchaeota archaeon]